MSVLCDGMMPRACWWYGLKGGVKLCISNCGHVKEPAGAHLPGDTSHVQHGAPLNWLVGLGVLDLTFYYQMKHTSSTSQWSLRPNAV